MKLFMYVSTAALIAALLTVFPLQQHTEVPLRVASDAPMDALSTEMVTIGPWLATTNEADLNAVLRAAEQGYTRAIETIRELQTAREDAHFYAYYATPSAPVLDYGDWTRAGAMEGGFGVWYTEKLIMFERYECGTIYIALTFPLDPDTLHPDTDVLSLELASPATFCGDNQSTDDARVAHAAEE